MAAQRAKKTAKSKKKPTGRKPAGITGDKLAAYHLRILGYRTAVIAGTLDKGWSTIEAWIAEVKEYFGEHAPELVTIEAAKHRLHVMVPQAMDVYRRAMRSKDLRVAKDAARDILISHRALIDRKEVAQDDTARPTSDLIAEAEAIIAGGKNAAGVSADDDQASTD